MAVRDADYDAMTWWPLEPALDRWMDLYQGVARANGAEPDAGRRLLSWSLEAGFRDVIPSASVWCHATRRDRSWWGELWAERILESDMSHQAVGLGVADRAELAEISAGWRRWASTEDGWFVVVHGEVLCRSG